MFQVFSLKVFVMNFFLSFRGKTEQKVKQNKTHKHDCHYIDKQDKSEPGQNSCKTEKITYLVLAM